MVLEFLSQFREQLAAVWGRLTRRQRWGIGGVVAVFALGLLLWSRVTPGGGNFVPLFTRLEPSDAGAVVEQLEEMQVEYRLAEQGSAILVDSDQVYEVRLTLAREGLPKGSIVGFEIFDQTSLGTTDFVRRVQYIRGLQGELARTINQIDGIERSSVHIVLPEPSLYTQNEHPPTAAVLLELSPGVELDRAQVRGIVHLVSRSVEGLSPEQITLLDDSGVILASGQEEPAGGALTASQIELQTVVQLSLERNVQSLLERVLGPGNVVTRVSAELDFDQKTISRRYFTPGDDQGIVRSVQELREVFEGGTAAAAASGTTGIPSYPAGTETGGKSSRTETAQTFEINETSETEVIAPGSVKRLSVAVMVNRATLTAPEQAMIENVVSAALGLDSERSDQITVAAFPFDTSLAEQLQEALADEAEAPRSAFRYWPVAVAVLVAGAVLALSLRRRSARQQREEDEALRREEERQMHLAAQEAAAAREAVPDDTGTVGQMAQRSPEEVARLVQAWLAEDRE